MKFRIENEPTPVTVPVRLERSENNVELFIGPYCYVTLRPDGSIRLSEFCRNSPMHSFCIQEGMTINVNRGVMTLTLEKRP